MLQRIRHDRVLELRMDRPPVNALNRELLEALREAIAGAPGEGAEGLVLSGGATVFSAGLDVPVLVGLDRTELEASWRAFFGVCEALARSPLPSVAAIGGHSPAGGAVIALFCDYRVMVHGASRIGLNETQVGLVVPDCIHYALARVVGRYRAERLIVSGAMVEAEQAHAIGLVDELAVRDQVEFRSVAWLNELLALPRAAVAGNRALARQDLVDAVADPARLRLPEFLERWHAPETQAVLRAVVARLKGG